MNELRNLPSLDALLKHNDAEQIKSDYGHNLTVKAMRVTLENYRTIIKSGSHPPSQNEILLQTRNLLITWIKPTLVQVINATGVILHTNLGRAPLSDDTIYAMQNISAGYSTLEYDLTVGKRGKRSIHAEELLKLLTGAESALIVNNNAAAVLLILSALARRKRAIIANSQLVEIGGGFRVPDVMRQSGAKLEAIGTTNRVHLSDYQNALEEPAAIVLTAHHSNFKIIGFTAEADMAELGAVCKKANVPLVCDLGSGALLDTAPFGLAHEPTIQENLEAGADLICFSGDKLIGGPQAGIIIGKKILIDKIKKHPLARSVRADKICLAGIAATLTHYLRGEALEKIPVWQMIAQETKTLQNKANVWNEVFRTGTVVTGRSMVGGGSLPGENLPTFLFAIDVKRPNHFLKKLRQLPVPVIARIQDDKVVFDPRTVLPFQESIFVEEIKSLLQANFIGE